MPQTRCMHHIPEKDFGLATFLRMTGIFYLAVGFFAIVVGVRKSRDGWLLNACKNRSWWKAYIALKLNANPDREDPQDSDLLRQPRFLRWLGPRSKRTPLHYAVLNGNSELVKLLINHKANVNAKSFYSMTPLHYAAEEGFIDIARLLLENDAEVNITDQFGWVPLSKAHSADMAKLLVSYGADIHSRSRGDIYPLECAIQAGDAQRVQFLIDLGAQPDVHNTQNLIRLVRLATPEVVICLLTTLEEEENVVLPNQFSVDEEGQKQIKTLQDICGMNLSRNNIEEIAEYPGEILYPYAEHLTFNRIKSIITLWKNKPILERALKQNIRYLVNQCCENQFKRIQGLIAARDDQERGVYDVAQNQLTKQLFEQASNARSFDEFPEELKNAVNANVMKLLELNREDI